MSLIQLERRKVAIEKRWRLAEVWLRHVIEPRFDCRDAVHLLEQNLLKQVNVGRSKDHSNWNMQQKHSFHAFVKREGQNKKIVFFINFYTCGHWPFKPLDPHTNSPNWSPYTFLFGIVELELGLLDQCINHPLVINLVILTMLTFDELLMLVTLGT